MGVGFVIFFHLVAVGILSVVIALVSAVAIFIFSDKLKRKRKLVQAAILPFAGLFTLYFSALFGTVITSSIYGVDGGIGDYWYVPISNSCELTFIDVSESADITKDGLVLVSEISQIQQLGEFVIGKTNQDKFFVLNAKTSELKEFASQYELIKHQPKIRPKLVKVMDFYINKREEIMGYWPIIMGVVSVAIGLAMMYLCRKIVISQFSL